MEILLIKVALMTILQRSWGEILLSSYNCFIGSIQ
jgi:hypothetical protein